MPRGGKQGPDDFSPHKTNDGRELKLLKSSKSATNYWCVVGPLRGKFYVKKKLDGEKGSKQSKLFAGKDTAREAAIALAEYMDQPYELPETKNRSKAARLEKLHAEAWELMRVPNPAWSEEEVAARFEEAGDRESAALWRMPLPPVVEADAVVEAEPCVSERVPAPRVLFDPEVLAKVASIKASGMPATGLG